MKKSIIHTTSFLLIFLLFSLILMGCNTNTPSIETPSTKYTVTENPPSSIQPDNSEESNHSPATPYTERDDYYDFIEDDISDGVREQIAFSSAADLHNFITTGSTDPTDYSDTGWSIYCDLEYVMEAYPPEKHIKDGYVNIENLLGIDEDILGPSGAGFVMYKGITYLYCFDNDIDICVKSLHRYPKGTTMLSYYTTEGIIYKLQSYDKNKTDYAEYTGHVFRSIDDFDILYSYKNGFIREINFVIDGYYISIYLSYDLDDQTKEEVNSVIQNFMTSEETSNLSVWLSPDDEAIKKSIQKVSYAIKDYKIHNNLNY